MIKRSVIISILIIIFGCTNSLDAQETGVYIFISEECPICIYMAPMLEKCAKDFPNEKYHLVFPMKTSNWKTAVEFRDRYELTSFKIIIDEKQDLTRELQASITPEVVIVNDEKNIAYRGRISDAYRAPGKMKHGPRSNELLNILGQLKTAQSIPQPWKSAIGCYITLLPQVKS